jgi:hypothetical protein
VIYSKAFVGFVAGIYTRSPAQHESGTEKNLLPAVYCLLDSLTSYETAELNDGNDSKNVIPNSVPRLSETLRLQGTITIRINNMEILQIL